MFIMKKHKIILYFVVLFVVAWGLSVSYAINTTSNGHQFTSLQDKSITLADNSCRRVTNNATNRFIPTRTMWEWNSFNAVAVWLGVSINSCSVDGSCWGGANTCSVGSTSGYSAGSCDWSQTWSCLGANGWSTASCSIANAPCCVYTEYDAYRIESNCYTVYPNGINWPWCMTSRYCDNDFVYPYYSSCTWYWESHIYTYGQFVWCY